MSDCNYIIRSVFLCHINSVLDYAVQIFAVASESESMLTSAVSFGKRSDGLAYRHRIAYSDICNLCFSVGHNFIRLENRLARFDIRKIAAYILKLCQRRQFIGQCGDSEIKVVYPRNRNSVSDLIHCFHNEFPP